MTLMYSLCQINHRPDPAGPEVIVRPDVVFNLDDKEVEAMTRLDAVREPTEDELKLYALANGSTLTAPKPAKPEKPAATPTPEPVVDKVVEPAGDAETNLLG